MRILLAEDEMDLNDILTMKLSDAGYSVDSCLDGEEALLYLSSAAYDVVILDIMMPKLDGVSALKQIRESGNYTPALFLTAKAEIDDRIAGLDAGADDFNEEEDSYEILTTPDNFQAVVEALNKENVTTASAEVTMIPQNYVEVTDPDAVKNLTRILDLLDEDDDVQNVYTNWDE